MILNIDKTDWMQTKLGEVAYDVNDRVDNPSTSGFMRFVGLEHFVSGDLKIKNWGTTENLVSAMKIFKTGDVLFARRNAHLRRASMADFDGVCSGDAFVLRENNKKIVPGFLAFILNTDNLWDYAIANAAGTMSKRVKWRDLAEYEFLLPPKEQQVKIAELLWTADELLEDYYKISSSLEILYQSMIENYFKVSNGWKRERLENISCINSKSLQANTEPNYEFEYLDISGIIEPKRYGALQKYKFSEAPSRAKRIVSNGSIVLSLVRPYHKSFVLIENAKDLIASTGTCVIDVKKNIDNWFIFHQFFTKRFLRYCEDRMSGTNYPAITPNDLKDFIIILPQSMEEQLKVSNQLNLVDQILERFNHSIANLNKLKKSLIHQFFET